MKAICRGPLVSVPLPFTGEVGVVLTIGTDTSRYCATFGGTTSQNDPSRLRRKNAPALDRCPAPGA